MGEQDQRDASEGVGATAHGDGRRFHRFAFDAAATLFGRDRAWPTRLLDVSLNGALVARPPTWSGAVGSGQRLQLALESGALISMTTTVVNVADDRLGLHFERIDMQSFTHLKRLIELNLGNSELLYRELGALG